MTKNHTFWWIALAMWMAGSAWWHTCKIKQLCDAPLVSAGIPSQDVNVPPLHITDGSGLSLIAPGNFELNDNRLILNNLLFLNLLTQCIL